MKSSARRERLGATRLRDPEGRRDPREDLRAFGHPFTAELVRRFSQRKKRLFGSARGNWKKRALSTSSGQSRETDLQRSTRARGPGGHGWPFPYRSTRNRDRRHLGRAGRLCWRNRRVWRRRGFRKVSRRSCQSQAARARSLARRSARGQRRLSGSNPRVL